jgi:hypothetical protein
MSKLGKTNEARRKVHAFELHTLFIERSRSSANGTHANRKDKRARTRSASKRKALRLELS